MKDLSALCMRIENSKFEILDQQLLPHKEKWLLVSSPEDMIDYIKKLKIRGAPALAVGAVLALGQYAESGANEDEFKSAAKNLREARPTAVNLMICIDKMLHLVDKEGYSLELVSDLAFQIFTEDVGLCNNIATYGADLIDDGDSILTHCNTGGLATAGVGTALGVIRKAHEQGKKIHVFVDETRPLLQGGRLTAWELQKLGIPYTLICDNMAAFLMSQGKIQKTIVGADRIAINGDFANKIGTLSVALSADYFNVPFYVAAPYTTVDPDCLEGSDIPIEERKPEEVRGVQGSHGNVIWSPKDAPVYNPAFDITPANLVSGWIMDSGVYNRQTIASLS